MYLLLVLVFFVFWLKEIGKKNLKISSSFNGDLFSDISPVF